MRLRLTLFGMMAIISLHIFSQERISELISGSVIPVDDEGSLNPGFKAYLKSELKEVRVLAIGEASHEDGSTFEQKAKLIRFLHEELNFGVLAFEYGFYGNWKANQLLVNGAEQTSAFKYAGWSKSRYAFPVYDYLAKTQLSNKPLHYAGFDGEKVPGGVPDIQSLIRDINTQLNFVISREELALLDSLIGAVYGGLKSKLIARRPVWFACQNPGTATKKA